MSAEFLEVFDIYGNYRWLRQRKEYEAESRTEFQEKWEVSTQVKRSVALIMNTEWKIILQKRSDDKWSNAWMYDKTVWGHTMVVQWYKKAGQLDNELANINMAKELVEELFIPGHIVGQEYFIDWFDFSLERMACITRIERIMRDVSVRKNKDWSEHKQPYVTDSYLWFYNWPLLFSDGEASGLECVSRDVLLERMQKYPDQYTDDLKKMVARYWRYLLPMDEFKSQFEQDGFTFNCWVV